MFSAMRGLLLLLPAVPAIAADGPEWQAVDKMVEQFKFLPNVSFSAGDYRGRVHTYEKGSITMQTPNFMASSSKFPAVIAIAGAVADGHLEFDTPVSKVLPWWTSDPKDTRSYVTLRHLLTFTSGLVSADFSSCGMKCLELPNASSYHPEDCAREIYESGPWNAVPGTIWSYHSLHLQVAGAVAAKAANLSVQGLIEKYLIKKVNMTGSFWLGYPNPHLAASMISNGDDYDKLLQAVLNYKLAPKWLHDELERDAYSTFPGLQFSQYPKDISLGYYGHYSMGTYYECVGQPWNAYCAWQGIHADPGAFGYWPLVDRSRSYYMQIVTMRPVTFPDWFMQKYHITQDTLAALPGHCTGPLRFGLQPFVEKALFGGSSTDAAEQQLHSSDDPLSELCKAAEIPLPPNPPQEAIVV